MVVCHHMGEEARATCHAAIGSGQMSPFERRSGLSQSSYHAHSSYTECKGEQIRMSTRPWGKFLLPFLIDIGIIGRAEENRIMP